MKQEQSSAAAEPRFAAFVAIDWADEKHVWCSEAAGSTAREHGEIDHNPEAIEAWVGMLSARFGSQPIAVAVEQSRVGVYAQQICPAVSVPDSSPGGGTVSRRAISVRSER